VSLALCYSRFNHIAKARKLIKYVVAENRDQVTSHILTRIHFAMGYADLAESRPETARSHLIQSYQLASMDSNKVYMADCLIELGKLHLLSGNLDSAEWLLSSGEQLSRKIRYRNGLEAAHLSLAGVYTKTGNITKLSNSQSVIIAIRDSSLNHSIVSNLSRLQYDYYEAESIRTIGRQSQLLSLQEKSIRLYNIAGVALILCTLLLVIVTFLLFRSAKLRKQRVKEMEQRVRERTLELAGYSDSIGRAKLERKFLLEGLARSISANLATMRGLGSLTRTYENVPKEFCANYDCAIKSLADILTGIKKQLNAESQEKGG
jgi:hypothetical protein